MAGMKAGSFCPSPSSVTINGARAAATPAAHRRRLAAGLLVPHAAQPGILRHQPLELGLGAVARAVIDVDDLEPPLAVERGGDLGHQGRDIAGLVAHRHHDGTPLDRWCSFLLVPSCAIIY